MSPGGGRPHPRSSDGGRRGALTIAALAWMALIFGLSSLPGSTVPVSGHLGSVGHFILYAVLGILLDLRFRETMSPRGAVIAAVAVASLYGFSDELHQTLVPGRFPDPADWVVDTLGAAAGAVASGRDALRGTPRT